MNRTSLNPVSAGQALQSMRDSDFDCYSAYAEAIDNSIQANATEIHIAFDTEEKRKGPPYEYIKQIAFVDNGDGMDEELIHNCLRLGYSSRFNDRSGIGRFGVGMTMGAIHECCNVRVFSRQGKQEEWLTTSLDISSSDDESVFIDPPKSSKFPTWIEKVEPRGSGTAVIWSNYDRQQENGQKIIDECKVYFGRVFRKFIWRDVKIFVNGEPVHAIDPLYARTDKTKFPKDIAATLAEPISLQWPIPENIAGSEAQQDTITIRLSLLDEGIRGYRSTGGRKEVTDRYIDRNQGISIMRQDREVAYGAIPYWPGDQKWFTQPDRWWGCEIEFSPLLDRAFQVRNIKRGAVPNTELKKAIFDKINPTIQTYLETIRTRWDEKEQEREAEDRNSGRHNSGHQEAEQIAEAKEKNLEDTFKPVDNPREAEQKLIKQIKKYQAAVNEKVIIERWRSQPYTIESDTWKGKEFIELKPLGGNDVLLYNASHILMKKLEELEERISANADSASVALAKEVRTVVDLLLLSYAKAESKMSTDGKKTDLLEILRMNWGIYARSYIQGMEDGENGPE